MELGDVKGRLLSFTVRSMWTTVLTVLITYLIAGRLRVVPQWRCPSGTLVQANERERRCPLWAMSLVCESNCIATRRRSVPPVMGGAGARQIVESTRTLAKTADRVGLWAAVPWGATAVQLTRYTFPIFTIERRYRDRSAIFKRTS